MNRESENTYTSPLKDLEIKKSATKRKNLEESSPINRQKTKEDYKIEVVDTSSPQKRQSDTNLQNTVERKNLLGVPGASNMNASFQSNNSRRRS